MVRNHEKVAKKTTLDQLVEMLSRTEDRRLFAIVGAPGSGKSTLSEKLNVGLNRLSPQFAAVLPMDGFHFDDVLLGQLGKRATKGAPDTFDVGGLLSTIKRLKENSEEYVAVPVFDRDIEISRGSARMISKATKVIIVEGNYLLLNDLPWLRLHGMFDVSVMVQASLDTLRQRLTARWASYDLPQEIIASKVEKNDMPNAEFVMSNSSPTDFVLCN